MTQGSARKSQNLHHLADESRLPNRMKSEYGKLMAANDFVYWAMDRESIRQQGRSGVHAGNAKVLLPRETGTGKPRIVAEGMTFSILLHELENTNTLYVINFAQNECDATTLISNPKIQCSFQ